MNDVQQAVVDYVRTPQTDYALLITGPWGCGKTYFWKHFVEPQLRQLPLSDRRLRPLYATLYGCRGAKDIDTQLFLASHQHLKKKWTRRLTSISGNILKALTRFELPAIDLRWLINTKDAVLCFDDLERTRLPMKEALGYINTFVEHEGVKVITLCNEAAITDEDDKETYRAMKEKIVGASLAFRPNLDTVFQTLIDEYRPRTAFHGFLSSNAELLRCLFDRSETQNIRSLRRALSALAVIFDALSSSKIDPNALAKQLICAVAPASFELHGRGAAPDDLRDILGTEHMALAGFASSIGRSEETGEEPYEKKFADRYFRDLGLAEWGDAVGCPPICEFLVTGMLDRKELISWARELPKQPDEWELRFTRLMQFPRDMEDEEFDTATARTIDEVESGQICDVGTYWGLYPVFEWFCDSGLIAMTRQELLRRFSDGLHTAQEGGNLKSAPRFRSAIDHPSLAPRTDEGRELCKRLVEANEALLRLESSQQVKAVASRLNEDPEGFMEALTDRGESGLLFAPVFQELDPQTVAEWILSLTNEQTLRFDSAIHQRYESHAPGPEFVVELPALKQIRDLLSAGIGFSEETGHPTPMSRLNLKSIVETLGQVIGLLEQLDVSANQSAVTSLGDQAEGA